VRGESAAKNLAFPPREFINFGKRWYFRKLMASGSLFLGIEASGPL